MTPVPPAPRDSDWLAPFIPLLCESGTRILEIGCGWGLDAATLVDAGFEVFAFDRATPDRARCTAPRAALFHADLARPLPLRDRSFDAALSSLALHYLPWTETRAAIAEIRRVLRPGAPFLFRVNATDDVNHGAGQGIEVEPNFYRTGTAGHADHKRFFDDSMVQAAVGGYFAVEHLAHRTVYRYEQPKQAWECLARAL